MLQKMISLQLVAERIRVSVPYAMMVLEGENVVPFKMCGHLPHCIYIKSDVQSVFPEIDF